MPPDRQRAGRPLDRVLAVVSLLSMTALVVVAIMFVVSSPLRVLGTVGGVLLGLLGSWWLVVGRGARRAVGALEIVIGLALLVWALVSDGGDTGHRVIRLIVVGVLFVATVAAGRGAIRGTVARRVGQQFRRTRPPEHPVLICNPRSGDGKAERFGLPEVGQSLGVETVLLEPGLDLEQLARDAVDRGADCLGMAGGDGSQALVAAVATESGVPFVCIPAGTRNHFALDLGLDRTDPRPAMSAFREGIERRVDYATVGDRLFVNNVSLGVYATIVQREEYRGAKLATSRALLPQLLGNTEEPFDLQFTAPDGSEVDGCFLVQVSNNPFVLGPSLDVSQRRRLDTGQLGIVAVQARTGAQAAAAVGQALTGRHARNQHLIEFTTDEFVVRSRCGTVAAGVDGEALELPTPLVFRIHPEGLRLLVPEADVDAVIRRETHDIRPSTLLALARA